MAGEAFRLVIPQDMLNKLQTADEKLAQLGKTSQTTQSQVIAAFKAMADGVNPFIQKLNEAQQALGNIKAFKGGDIKLGNIATEATKSADAVNELVQVIAKLVQENKKLQEQQLSSRGITIAQEGTLGKKESNLNYKSLTNDVKELHNAEMERGRELVRQNSQNIANQRVFREQLKRETNEKIAEARKASANIQILSKEEIAAWKRASNERIANDNDASKRRIAQQKRETNEIIAELNRESRERIKEANRIARLTRLPSTIDATTAQNIISKSGSAVSINQLLTSIKNLEKAKKDLDTTDKNYKKTLAEIDNAINKNKQSLRQLGVETENVRKHQSNLMNHAQQLRRALALVFSVSQITGYTNKMVQVRGEFELQQRSLQAILQNKDEADKLWQQTVDLAVRSPFRVKELVSYTKQLAAYRVETEKLHDTTKMLSDVSAGLGVDMQRLILAYGQVKAANYLRGTELRQFSEAGINILGELAKYFTELEGRAVSVGEVFERVSKRMVAFSDVEEIFKRVTSEGGVFYRMQEIQSETVKGLISNLYDQIDLMLNDIGKSNDGALKGAIELVKEFVESWREVVWYLEKAAISFAAYTAATKLAKLGTSDFTQALLGLGTGANGAAKGITFLKNAWLGLKSATIVGLITTAAFALLELFRNATKANREAERLQKELNEIYNADYSAFKQQTKTFNDLVEKLKNVNEGSQEHRDIIGKLNSQYGEYIGFIVTEATTYDKLKGSIDRVSEALMRKAKMNTYEKAYSKIFEETNKTIDEGVEKLKKDIKGLTITRDGNAILPTEDEINDIVKILEKRLASMGKKGTPMWSDVQAAFEEYGLQIEEIRGWSNYTLYKWRNAIVQQKEAELKLEEQINGAYNETTAKTFAQRKALEDVNKREKERLETLEKQGNTSTYNYKKEVDRIKKEAQIEKIKVNVEYEFPKAKKEEKDSIIAKRVSELNTLSATIIDVNDKIEKSVGKLGEKYTGLIYIDEAEAATGISQIAENTAQAYKAQQEIIEQQNALKSAGTVYDEDVLDNAKKTAKAYYYKLELLGRLDLLQKQRSKEESKELQMLKKQLDALKEAKQTFDNLRQKFGLEESTRRTAKAFEDLFAELEMTQFTINMSFDNQGIIDVIEELPNKAGKAGEQALEKMKAELRGGLDVDIKVRKDEDLANKIADMFSGYELSLELQKLNIPPDLAKQLFNVDSLTLPELKTKLQGMESEFVGTDMEKEYRDALRKVDEMERKAQEERLKRYSQFLIKGYNERINLKIQELRELELLEQDKEKLTPQQYEATKKGIQEEYRIKALQQQWKDFEQSAQYINLFDDIENTSTASLQSMKSNLEQLKQSMIASGLPAKDLKEILDQLNKVEEELENRAPFKTFIDDVKTTIGGIKEQIALRKEEKRLIEDIKRLENEKPTDEQVAKEQNNAKNQQQYQQLLSAQQLLGTLKEGTQEYEKQEALVAKLEKYVYPLTTAHNEITEKLKEQEKQLGEVQEKVKNWKEALKGIGGSFVKFGDKLSDIGSFVDDIAGKWKTAFGMSDTAMADLQTFAGIAQGAGQAISSIGQGFMTGDWLSAGMGAVSGIMSIASTLGQAHDKKKERQIEREMKLVERLQKVYEDLGETIQNTYSLDTLNEATQMSRENLMAQINATERMIEAEKDKKDTDWERIEDWKDQIEEAKEAMKELEETRLQELGAFASDENKKSGAQAFVDAWFEAYKQTGDGLTGLNEQFDEFFEDMIKKQLLQRGTQEYLDSFFNTFDTIIDGISKGGNMEEGINKILTEWDATSPQLDALLEKLADAMGVAGDLAGKDAELGGLQAGIQGITEDQADVLASYMNSVRFYVADNNTKFADLITRLFDSEGSSNPMLAELRAQTAFIQEIRDVLGSVVGRGNGGSHSGAYLKVAIG